MQTAPNASDTGANESNTDGEGATSAPKETDWKAEADRWKALSRQNEARAKANADKAKRLDEIEEQAKTEMQKAIERAEAAEKRAADLEVQATRARIAAAKGVSADLLTGTTEEEITESADRLLAWRSETSTPPKPPASTPATDAGARGDVIGSVAQLTREDLKSMTPKQINEARIQGRLNHIMGVKV